MSVEEYLLAGMIMLGMLLLRLELSAVVMLEAGLTISTFVIFNNLFFSVK